MAFIRLPELEDSPHFPPVLRRLQVEFIGWLVRFFRVYAPLVEQLKQYAMRLPGNSLVELGAGSGQVLMPYIKNLDPLKLVLSDKFPESLPPDNSNYLVIRESVDALQEFDASGMRVFFNAFHHFNNAEQIQIAQIHAPHGLCIAEILQPSLFDFLKILITTTVGTLLFTPFVRPFRLTRILFTYLIPVGLISICWDGLVSVLKTDRVETIKLRLKPNLADNYQIECGHCGSFLFRVHYLFILPSK